MFRRSSAAVATAEKASTSEDQAGQARTDDVARNCYRMVDHRDLPMVERVVLFCTGTGIAHASILLT